MGKKATKKVSYTTLIIGLGLGILAAIFIVYRTGNYAFAVLAAALGFAIGLASLVKSKK